MVVIDGKSVDVTSGTPLAQNKTFCDALRPRVINGDWLLTSGGPVLQAFSRHRNPRR
jgi:hypothetical protein